MKIGTVKQLACNGVFFFKFANLTSHEEVKVKNLKKTTPLQASCFTVPIFIQIRPAGSERQAKT
jgi:hypothetical protein